MDQGFETVYVAQGELEESQVRTFLAAHGITTWVRGEALRKTHGLTLDQLTNADFLAAGGDVIQAMKNLGYGQNEIDEVICTGCGVCASSCRSGALDVGGARDEQILAQLVSLGMSG